MRTPILQQLVGAPGSRVVDEMNNRLRRVLFQDAGQGLANVGQMAAERQHDVAFDRLARKSARMVVEQSRTRPVAGRRSQGRGRRRVERRDCGFGRKHDRPAFARGPMHKLGVSAIGAVGEPAHIQQRSAAEHQCGRGQVALKDTAGLARLNGSRGRRQRRRQDLRSAGHQGGHRGRQPISMTDRADFLNGHEFGPQLRQELVQRREQPSRGGIPMNDDVPLARESRDQRRSSTTIVDEMNNGHRPVLLQGALDCLFGRRRGVGAADDHVATPKA